MLPQASLKDKLKYLPRPTQQFCMAHLSPALFFCSKPTCQVYTFLCKRCHLENLHGHTDQISDYFGWVQRMSQKVKKLKVTGQQRIFQSVRSEAGKSVQRYVRQLRRVLEVVEALEEQVCELIRQSKAKISGYIRKYQGFGESRLASKGHLYANPFLLAGKLNSERNDDFVQELKQCLRGQAQLVDGFNPKYEVINLQNKLKQVIDGNATGVFTNNKEVSKIPKVQTQQKRIFLCDSKPQKIFMRGSSLLIGLRNETQIYGLVSGTVEDRLAVGLNKVSSVGQDFIGINKQNSRELITYIEKQLGSFIFEFRLCSILLYNHKSKHYAIIGRQQGKISVFDIQSNQILATLQQQHNTRVQYLQPWEGETKILSCGKTTAVSIYKIIHQSDEVILQFQEQLNINTGQIKQFQVYNSLLVAILQGKNMLVFDLVLKVPLIQYENTYEVSSKECDYICLLQETDNGLMLASHNEGQSFIWVWSIDKQKKESLKCEKMVFFDKEDVSIVEMNGRDVWLVRPNENQRKIYNFYMSII